MSGITNLSKKLQSILSRFATRTLDLVGAGLGLLILAPFFALIAYRIKRDSPGPVYFRGRRAGRNGKPFYILKFRTMHEHPDSYQGPKVTAKGDRRITSIGRWLRDTKLNELPQLWNVLVGEMSLVGPRPEDPDIVATWPEDVRREILAVRPGITSPATVMYRDEENLLSSERLIDEYLHIIVPSKLRLDLLYIRNRTLLNDLDVLFLTLIALLPQIGKRPVPEHLLFWGPLSRFISRNVGWFSIDFIVAMIAVGMSGATWRSVAPLNLGWGNALLMAFSMALLFSLLNAIIGVNRVDWSKALASEALDLVATSGSVTLISLLVNGHIGLPELPMGMLLISGLLAFLGFVTMRYRGRLLTGMATRWLQLRGNQHVVGERALIVGAGEMGQFITWFLRTKKLTHALNIIGMVDDNPKKIGMRLTGYEVLGRVDEIPHLVQQHDIGVIIFSINRIDPTRRTHILDLCRSTSAQVVVLPDLLLLLQGFFTSTNGTDNEALTLMPEAMVAGWLDELEAASQAGDMQEVAKIIRKQRKQLRTRSIRQDKSYQPSKN